MRTKPLSSIAVVAALGAAYLGLRSPGAPEGFGPAGGPEGSIFGAFGYVLTGAEIVDPGRTAFGPAGPTTTGYRIRAAAARIRGDFPAGEFLAVLDAYALSIGASGQGPAAYQIRGTWTIVAPEGIAGAGGSGHGALVLSGPIEGELTFNPAAAKGAISLSVNLPMSTVCYGRGRGRVTFQVNERFEGRLTGTYETTNKMSS